MSHYLVSYSVYTQKEARLVTAGVVPVKSDEPATLTHIGRFFELFYSGGDENVLYLTNVQKISEDDYIDYGGFEIISN